MDLSSSYPDAALGLETICHLIVSALAYWPAFAWAPGLFHTLLDSVQAASLSALGPKKPAACCAYWYVFLCGFIFSMVVQTISVVESFLVSFFGG